MTSLHTILLGVVYLLVIDQLSEVRRKECLLLSHVHFRTNVARTYA